MTPYEQARSIAQTLLASEDPASLSREKIAIAVDQALAISPGWRLQVDRDSLIKDVETRFHVWIGQAKSLEDLTDHVAWLPSRRMDIEWRYWDRYKQLLERSWAPQSVARLDELTDEVVGRLEDPRRTGPWDRRGLIVGHVQSGKTANYAGLICKAADTGYRLIIVLAGMHNNLRSQTQMRLDEGFLGYESAPPSQLQRGVRPLGVGLIDSRLRPDTVTNRTDGGDFRRSVANNFNINPGNNHLLFVVKKNGGVLRNLLEWVEWAANSRDVQSGRPIVAGVPLLLIDDEADHGSVDTKEIIFDEDGNPDEDHQPTVINQRIRRLLYCFEQSAYVGYTATPFANIFIHERAVTADHGEDLFPRSFITNLAAPSNYDGPVRVFGVAGDPDIEREESRPLPVIRFIGDHADSRDLNERHGWMPPRHKNGHMPQHEGRDEIPPSLRTAIYSFVLASAARRVRGQVNQHNSMLIHVTRFTNVQDAIVAQVRAELAVLQNRLRYGDGGSQERILDALQRLWQDDFIHTTRQFNDPSLPVVPWDRIQPLLLGVATSIQVRQINGSAGDVLDYDMNRDTGLTVIAVGGDKLARGLTLEGLVVSYFLRHTKMYDTLMQMGRWFGYRPGYLDLSRLFMTRELCEWFQHITEASEELRLEFDHMAAVGGTPRDYGLKVKSHPVLMVTSAVKMRTGTELSLSFAGDICETTVFYKDSAIIQRNLEAASSLIQRLGRPHETNPRRARPDDGQQTWRNTYLWSGVAATEVQRFLRDSKTHPAAHKVVSELLSQFIEKQTACGELTEWTVALISSGEADTEAEVGGLTVGLIKRHPKPGVDDPERYVIRRLLSPKDEAIDLDRDAYTAALDETRTQWTADPGRSGRTTPPDVASGPMIRYQRASRNGLLMIYPLDPKAAQVSSAVPIIGFGISFPSSTSGQRVIYRVNNVYWQQEFGGID